MKKFDLKSKTSRIVGSIGIFIAIIVVILWYIFFSPTFHPNKKAYVYVDADDTQDSIIAKVRKTGKPSSLTSFKWLIKHQGYKLHTGRYAITPGEGSFILYHRLASGRQSPIEFSINNIRTKEELARSIAQQFMMKGSKIEAMLNDSAYCAQLGYTPQTIVAMFIPDTYEFYWDIKPKELFKKMKNECTKFWDDDNRAQKAKEIGFTPVQVTTIASIVEEETNNEDEKPMVAGLYINRLRKGMKLQSDPTIRFALQDFTIKRIGGSQLFTNSPYNTYKHEGLPPGPIRIPSIKGIDAVLNYTHHNYVYMCAKEDFSGTHNFAETWQEHEVNAKRYQEALNKRNINLK
jgi:UPF0755 protein